MEFANDGIIISITTANELYMLFTEKPTLLITLISTAHHILCNINFRQLSLRTSNRKSEQVITNALFRLSVHRKNPAAATRSSFEVQQSLISQASQGLSLGQNTAMTNEFLNAHQTASLTHLKRIGDYLELGPGTWYTVEDQAIVFRDGWREPEYHAEGPSRTHFR